MVVFEDLLVDRVRLLSIGRFPIRQHLEVLFLFLIELYFGPFGLLSLNFRFFD